MALSMIREDEAEEFIVEPFTLYLQLLLATRETKEIALIDSRDDYNIMSYETWESLGKPKLSQSKLSFKNFSRLQTSSLGKFCVKAYVQDH